MISSAKVEFGDFQTPPALARAVCELLLRLGENPGAIVEPTAGRGAFLKAAVEFFPRAILRGWEINPAYAEDANRELAQLGASARGSVICRDFFTCDWDAELHALAGNLLVLGNPPWVTSAGVAAVNGSNLPTKANFHRLRGIAARTGKANFDISEWMLIRLLQALPGRSATIAMLCKTATARKFLRYAWQNEGHIATASLYRIDSSLHFEAAVDACLLFLRTGEDGPHEADVYESLTAAEPASRFGLMGEDLVADARGYRALQHLEGCCPFRWRSGIKHDCAAVMELRPAPDGGVENSEGHRFELEPDHLYPLLKCSDLANGRVIPARLVLVTQRFVGDDTAVIETNAPLTWNYLQSNCDRFLARKSSIYRGRASFSLFGIGEYAFSPWKVAISGLHKSALFQVVGPCAGRPVFFDDTCYYLSFAREADARAVNEVLNSEPAKHFIATLIFRDSKRPITVDLLQRLNLAAIATEAGLEISWKQVQRDEFGPGAPQLELVMEPSHRAVSSSAPSAPSIPRD